MHFLKELFEIKLFDKISKHFSLNDHFINSHILPSWLYVGIIRGKLMPVTGFKSLNFDPYGLAKFIQNFLALEFNNLLLVPVEDIWAWLEIFIKKQKLIYFALLKGSKGLGKIFLAGKIDGKRERGQPRRQWERDACLYGLRKTQMNWQVFFIILVFLCSSDWRPWLFYLVESDFRRG